MARLIKYSPTSKGTMVPDRKGNWYFVEEVAPLLAVEKLTTTNSAMVPCQHVWVPFIAHPPIEQCTQCAAVRRAQHQ